MRSMFKEDDEQLVSRTHFNTSDGNAHTEAENCKTIFSCPECGQKLRVPAGKSLDVTCAKCRNQFLVTAHGEIVRRKFRIIEPQVSSLISASEENELPRDSTPKGNSLRCIACGLERNISPGAQGFHCAGCKQYNEVGAAAGSIGRGVGSAEFATPKQVREATVCAVIGCNEPIPAGRIVCSKHG
jgi:hypothetical protein